MRNTTIGILVVVWGAILSGWQYGAVAYASPTIQNELLAEDRALSDSWDSAVKCLDNDDFSTARSYLQYVIEHKKTNGIKNLYLLADIVTQRIEHVEELDESEADKLVVLVRSLAPDSPQSAFASSSLRISREPGLAISDLFTGLSLSWLHLPTRVLMTGRLAMALVLSILCSLFLLSLSLLVRYWDRFVHGVSHLFPKAFRGIPLGIVLFALITIVPFSLGAGVTVIAMVWLLLLWPYFSRRERIISGLLMLLTSSIPFLNMIYAGALDYPTLSDAVVYECMTGRCSAKDRKRLQTAIDAGEQVHHANIALGLHYKHVTSRDASANAEAYRLAENHFKAALAYDEKSYMATVNLANLQYSKAQQDCLVQGPGAVPDLDAVNKLYSDASKLSTSPVESEYNRSVLHRHLDLDSEAAYFRAQATAINSERVSAWEQQAPPPTQDACPFAFNANVELMDVTVTSEMMLSDLWRHRPVSDVLLVPYGRLLVGSIQSFFFLPYGLSCAFLLFISGYLTRFIRPAKQCRVCGRVTCSRCRKEVKYLDVCPRCIAIRLKGAFVDSRQRWLQERERVELQVRGARALLWWSVLFPGLTQLSAGRCISGSLYAFSFTLLMVVGAAGPYLIFERAPTGASLGFGSGVLLGLAGILYLSSLWGAIRLRRKA